MSFPPLDDVQATIKALTDPVELKLPRSSGMKEKIELLESRLSECDESRRDMIERVRIESLKLGQANIIVDNLRRSNTDLQQNSKEKIESLESQLLARGQSLERCESEKASIRSQLALVTDTMSAASESLAQLREVSPEKIKRLESQLLACGQSLSTCESEKTSANAELDFSRVKIATISESAKVQTREFSRIIDDLRRTKTSLERTSKAVIQRLKSHLVTCRQSLETCGSEKASAHTEMTRLEGDIATILESAREQSSQLNGQINDLRRARTELEQTSRQEIERVESRLLDCGQALETCESEKASMRSQLSSLEADMATISERLARVRGESREHNRVIDDLIRAKTALEQTIRLLRAAVDEGLLNTSTLRAEIEKLKEDIRILREAAGERARENPEPVPDPQPAQPERWECVTPFSRSSPTAMQRRNSCVRAEGGRYPNYQTCVEQCSIP